MQHFLNCAFLAAQYFVDTDFCLSSSSPRFMFELPKHTKLYRFIAVLKIQATFSWKPTWFKCQCIWNLRTEITELRTENTVSRLRDRHFNMVLWTARRSPHSFEGKGTTHLLSYFKNPSIGLALGIKAATSRSAVQRSTNGVNSAWVKRKLPYYRLFHPNLVPRASLYPIFWSARDWDSNNKEPGQPVLIVVPNTAFIVTVHEYLVASFSLVK